MREFSQAKYQVWLLNKRKDELSKNLVIWRSEYIKIQTELRQRPDHPNKDQMAQQMLALARQIEDVRGAIGRGAADALVTFIAAINQQLALELGRFLEGGESIRASITKLSQQIEKSREAKQDAARKPPGPANQELRN